MDKKINLYKEYIKEQKKFVEIEKKYKNPLKIVFIYGFFGFIWIIFSDKILSILINNPEVYQSLQTYKGWFYVFITSLFLFHLIKFDYDKMKNLSSSLILKNDELIAFSGQLIAMDQDLEVKIKNLNKITVELRKQKEFSDEIYEKSNAVIIIWNTAGEIIRVNKRFVELLGYSKEEILGKNFIEVLIPEKDKKEMKEAIKNIKNDYVITNFENEVLDKYNNLINMVWNDSIINNPIDNEISVVSFGIDVTNEKKNEKKIRKMAYFDELTGLGNKRTLENNVENLIKLGKPFIIYYIDIDNFKRLNDIHGHSFGDILLKKYSKKLLEILDNNKVYRWCGDEFVMVQEGNNEEVTNYIIKEIIKLSKKNWDLDGVKFKTSSSLGIAKYPNDGSDFSTLLKNIDIALYKAKGNGKNKYEYYNTNIKNELEFRANVEKELDIAIKKDLFELNFQPIYDFKENLIKGAEVLLRWKTHNFDNLTTLDFIKIAENTGQILDIDKWVIKNTFKFIETNLSEINIIISINLSAKSFNSNEFICFLEDNIKNYDISPNFIEFEITEHSIIYDFENAIEIIKKIKKMGFSMSLDDFGTDYSSLNYLAKLPLDKLKIDKSYIDNILKESTDGVIVSQVIELSHKLGLETIAEGIENNKQKEMLLKFGCNYGQGYYLAKPMNMESLIELIS